MELRMNSNVITDVERGVPSEAEYIGSFYVKGKQGGSMIAHTTEQMSCTMSEVAARLTPVVRGPDNVLRAVSRDYIREVELCEKCGFVKDLDNSWRDQAACVNADTEDFFNDKRVNTMRERYCDKCPVVLECLEYGAAMHKENAGAVWGGVYFSTRKGQRLRAIEARRKELSG